MIRSRILFKIRVFAILIQRSYILFSRFKEIEREREKLPLNDSEELSKRELRRKMKAALKAIIKQADNADVKEAFEEPQTLTLQESSDPAQEPPQRQIVMTELPPQVRKARPPRSCRKPSELNQ